jgi:geranylgeranyl pyrophosphate synthase
MKYPKQDKGYALMQMCASHDGIEQMKEIVTRRGEAALETARAQILSTYTEGNVVSEALRYFANVTLKNVLPVFPALASLACEAVGGKPEKTVPISAALLMVAGAADLHDDVIDHSLKKGTKQTVTGKYGDAIAILAGDLLLIQGLTQLQRECAKLTVDQAEKIMDRTVDTAIEITMAEAEEALLQRKRDVSPESIMQIIDHKAAVPELFAKVGVVVGNGDTQTENIISDYGRTYGRVSLIVEEFMDLHDYQELKSRLKSEVPPLPLLYALKNMQEDFVEYEVFSERLKKDNLETILQLVSGSQSTKKLVEYTLQLVKKIDNDLSKFSAAKASEELLTLINSIVQLIQ